MSLPIATAVAELAAFGVNVGALSYAFDSSPPGSVLTNIAPFLSTSFAGQYIPVTVSNGLTPLAVQATVPNVVGLFYSDAQLALGNARLLTSQPQFVVSSIVKPQYVISQSVAAGTQVAEQTPVSIVVSGFPVVNQGGVVVGVP